MQSIRKRYSSSEDRKSARYMRADSALRGLCARSLTTKLKAGSASALRGEVHRAQREPILNL